MTSADLRNVPQPSGRCDAGIKSDKAAWVSSTCVFCNYPDSSGGMILRIHQIYYSALSGWSDTTYSEKAQGVSIFHSGVGSLSSHANNFPLWTVCQLIYIPLKMWDWSAVQRWRGTMFSPWSCTCSTCVISGGGEARTARLLCQHMPTLYNSARSVALRHTDNNLPLFNKAAVKWLRLWNILLLYCLVFFFRKRISVLALQNIGDAWEWPDAGNFSSKQMITSSGVYEPAAGQI